MTGRLCPISNSREPCSFAKAPDCPLAYTLNILWFQEEGSQVPVSECGQGLTFTQNVVRGFLLAPLQVHTVNSNSRTSTCQCSIFSKKNPIIRIFCISGWLVLINPDKRLYTVFWNVRFPSRACYLFQLKSLLLPYQGRCEDG